MICLIMSNVFFNTSQHSFSICFMLVEIISINTSLRRSISVVSPNLNLTISLVICMHNMRKEWILRCFRSCWSFKLRLPHKFHLSRLFPIILFIVICSGKEQSFVSHLREKFWCNSWMTKWITMPSELRYNAKFLL